MGSADLLEKNVLLPLSLKRRNRAAFVGESGEKMLEGRCGSTRSASLRRWMDTGELNTQMAEIAVPFSKPAIGGSNREGKGSLLPNEVNAGALANTREETKKLAGSDRRAS